MEQTTYYQRPALITVQPTAAIEVLHRHDARPLVLPPQPPRSVPTAHGWEMLPATTGPLIVDFTGQSIIHTAMRVTDLQFWQRRHQQIPIVLVPEAALAQQRVIAAADVRAVVLPTEQPAMLARWLHAPVVIGAEPVWVGLTPPPSPTASSQFVPLFAARSRAASVAQAATWCADWVNVLPDDALQICFSDQTVVILRTSHAVFARAHARYSAACHHQGRGIVGHESSSRSPPLAPPYRVLLRPKTAQPQRRKPTFPTDAEHRTRVERGIPCSHSRSA